MDLVLGKCAQTGLLGFLIGGGFPLWQHLADRARAVGASGSPPPTTSTAPPSSPRMPLGALVREALHEGLRTSRILVAATAASGTASFLQHGRYSERLFRLRGDPLSTFGGVFAAVYFFTDAGPQAGAGAGAGVGAGAGAAGGAKPTTLPMQSLLVAGGPAHRLGSAFTIACIAGAVSGAMGR